MARGETMTGTLHLVGVGPGDPDLMTIKAAKLLDDAAVIAYVATESCGTLALDIARRHCNPHAEYLPIDIPMATDRQPAQAAYDAGADAIHARLNAGLDVAYLCEGDPLFYGSAMYLLARLAGSVPVKVIPGVTSLTAAAAAIARPLAARNEVLKVLPAPLPDPVLRSELADAESAAIIKVGRHFDRIRALLAETGHSQGAVVIEHATTARERITRLSDFAHDERPYFSTILCYRGREQWA
jgi:precorrin-2/cobalt-factor-2 C20-methyltransferase